MTTNERPCARCTPYFDHPHCLCLGRAKTERELELARRFSEDWEVLSSWTSNPESGLYVECSDVRCRGCGQRAYCDDSAWDGGAFRPTTPTS